MTARRALLSGSLESFRPDEVLQWFAHRRGEATVVFRPAAGAGRCVVVHVRDGAAQAVKLGAGEARAAGPGQRPAGPQRGRLGRPARGAVDGVGLEPRAGSLGALLLERGALSAGQLRAGLGLQRLVAPRRRRAIGQIVCDLGFAEPGLVEELLREQALQRLAALLQVRAGSFAAYPGAPAAPVIVIGERIDHLLLRLTHLIDQAQPALSRG